MSRTARAWRRTAAAALALTLLAGCAARSAYRQGLNEGKRGNWDVAVARLTKALDADPDSIPYRIALENARVQASRMHHVEARKKLAAVDLEGAANDLEIASKYDPGNKSAADDLTLVRERIRVRDAEKQRLSQFERAQQRAQSRVAVPVLSSRSPVPITLNFSEHSLEKVLETLGRLAGVNLLFDEQFRDKKVGVRLTGVTFQEALDQICLVNRLFYKVLDQNTLIIVPESAVKRRSYDEVLVRTFYLQNAEATEIVNVIKQITGITKVQVTAAVGAVTVAGTPDKLAMVETVLAAHDKARGEVMVQIEILEVNRNNLKRYGLSLSNYEASTTLSPTGAEGEVSAGFTNARAHLLSSLNLADFVVNIPSTLLAQFLQTESTVRILASPRLRAAEGKKTALRIGTEVPIPVTTFTAANTGGSTFSPATSFQYRNVGVSLDLQPKVNAAGEITLELSAEFSLLGDDRNVGSATSPLTVPTFLSRNVTGTLRLRDGETSLIGGLLQGRDSDSFRGALGLKNVPLLNRLLGGNTKQMDETEILISITPHLVRAPKVTEADLVAVSFGTEEVPRVLGARPLFGPEPEATPTPAPVASPTPEVRPGRGDTPPRPRPAASPSPPATTPRVPDASADGPGTAPPAPPPAAVAVPTTSPTPAALTDPGRAALLQVRVAPAELRARAGESLSAILVLAGSADVTAVEVVLRYDAALLEGLDGVAGALLTLDGQPVGVERTVEPGRLRIRFSRPTPASGSGAVVSFRARAGQAGIGSLVVESLTLFEPAGLLRLPLPAPVRVEVLP